jgi:hypothetical protein
LTVIRGLSIIAVCIVGFGVAGALLGLTLGIGAPAYYRGTFRAGDNPAFNPVQGVPQSSEQEHTLTPLVLLGAMGQDRLVPVPMIVGPLLQA